MHLKDDMLRAYLDRELSAGQSSQVKEHLSRCPACMARVEKTQARMKAVQARMDNLAPGPRESSRSPKTAYQRFARNKKESIFPMLTKRPLWAALTFIVVLALAFSLPPVRGWASSFLGLFRVQKVQVISIDPSVMAETHEGLAGKREVVENLLKENLVVDEKGEGQTVASVEEAAQVAGFTPRLPALEGENNQPQLFVRPGMTAKFTIDQPALQSLIDVAEMNVELPEEVNGKVVTLDVDTTVVAAYGEDCPLDDPSDEGPFADCMYLMQVPSPSIDAPSTLNVQELGEAMFRFLGMPEAEAEKLAQSTDWTSTLFLPIPTTGDIAYQDVNVDGVTGTLLQEVGDDKPSDRYSLIWVKDGMLYFLTGSGGPSEALAITSTIQ